MSTINKAAYAKLIAEDLDWLAICPASLEHSHIEQVLKWSVEAAYAEADDLRKAAQAVLDSMTVKDYGEVLPPTLASIEALKDALRRRGVE